MKAKGIEVLLMTDRIDEWMIGYLGEYAGKKLRNAAKGDVPLDEADKKKQEEATKAAEPVLKKLKDLLGDRVGEVKVSARLTDSPSCLALSDYEMAPHMARLLREAGQDMPETKPTLEINPQHALVKRVEAKRRSEGEGSGNAAAGTGGDFGRRAAAGSGGVRAADESRVAGRLIHPARSHKKARRVLRAFLWACARRR